MTKAYVRDALWEIIAPLLPAEPAKPHGGRPRLSARVALNGILFVLYTGIGWEFLPQDLGWGSGMTCWRHWRDWHAAGVWQRFHHELLQRLHDRGQIDWSRAAVDASSILAKRGARKPVRIPPTGDGQAPSAIWWWTDAASPSQGPMCMTANAAWKCSTPSLGCTLRDERTGGHASVPRKCMR